MSTDRDLDPDSVIEVNSWDQLQSALETHFSAARWVFRGQRDARWQLATKFERVCAGIERAKWPSAEQHALRQFQRRLHQYSITIPEADDTLEWLALMQHHGAPTRLLDWTRSPYIAVYFAVEDASAGVPCSVSIINRQAMHNEVLEAPALFAAVYSSKTERLSDKAVFNEHVMQGGILGVISVEPFRMNERLTVQQGLFLVPISIKSNFLANLKGGTHLYRIDLRLAHKERLRVIEELRKMNIHRASLFPGIDGFAQSLATEIEIWGGFDDQRILLDGYYNELF